MNKFILALLLVVCLPCWAEKMSLGDMDNLYIPKSDKEYDDINKAIEYLKAKTIFVETQKKLFESQGVSPSHETGVENEANFNGAGGMPRNLRGRAEADVLLDRRGNRVVNEKPAMAYLVSTYSLAGNYKAEVFWGDRSLVVSEGDTLVGGNWKVSSVNRSDIVLTNSGKTIRLGVAPVSIESLLN